MINECLYRRVDKKKKEWQIVYLMYEYLYVRRKNRTKTTTDSLFDKYVFICKKKTVAEVASDRTLVYEISICAK